jgi:iron(II)-dependent oxidoreductase
MTQALAHHPVQILTNSDFLTSQATAAGLDTRCWHTVPNALLTDGVPPPTAQRDRQRLNGPIRIVARAEPHKGIAELIEACPAHLDRPVEIVLADAAFEYWPGMQREVISTCHRLAATRPAIRLHPALPWQAVQPFLADAACTIISSTSPETFCNTALEALSVATPVVTFDLGHVPRLIGQAGVVVPTGAGAAGLWDAAGRLLADSAAYQAASAAGPPIAARHTPAAAADAFLSAVAGPTETRS